MTNEEELRFRVVETSKNRRYEPIPKPGGDLMIKIVGKSKDSGDKLIFQYDGDRDALTDRQYQLRGRVVQDPRKVPEDADPGDTYTIDEILDDVRTVAEIREDAIEKARQKAIETDENIVIQTAADECMDPMRECELDQIVEYVNPFGEIETKRMHTTRHDSTETFYSKLDIPDDE